MDGDGRVFLEVKFKLSQAVVDYTNKHKIAPPNSFLDIPHMGKENGIILHFILVTIRLEDDGVIQ